MASKVNAELQENQENWLFVFRQCYVDTISLQDVQELSANFVLGIYLQFIKVTLGASLDNMKLIGQDCSEHMQKYPEAYEKAVLFPRVAKLMSWFFNKFFGDDSFTFGDLMNPNPSRTRNFFNCIVNFVYDFNEYKEKFDRTFQEAHMNKERLAALHTSLEQTAARMKHLRQHLAEQQIKEEEELKYHEEMMTELDHAQQLKAEMQAELDMAKQALVKRHATLDSIKLSCIELQQERDQLQSCVVSTEEEQLLRQREEELQQITADNNSSKQQLSESLTLLKRKEGTTSLFTDHILSALEDLAHQLKDKARLTDTSDVTALQSRAVCESEEFQHQLSVLRQRLTCFEDARKAALVSWTKKKEGIEADLRGMRELLEKQRRSDETHESSSRQLSEQLQESVQQLDEIAAERELIATSTASMYSELVEAMDKHNMKTHDGFRMFFTQVEMKKKACAVK